MAETEQVRPVLSEMEQRQLYALARAAEHALTDPHYRFDDDRSFLRYSIAWAFNLLPPEKP